MLRSPLFEMNGGEIRSPPATSGANRIRAVSSFDGQSERTAKYQSRYQSGRGAALIKLGSGGSPISGGPTKMAIAAMPAIITSENTTSRHAASGQNGTPSFLRNA